MTGAWISSRSVQALTAILAIFCASIGALAVVAPHVFYRHVIGVALLGPYNEHLTTDVGGLYLGFAVVMGWATWRPALELVRAGSSALLLTQALHFGYHLAHLGTFTFRQAVEQTAGLLPLVVLPVAVLLLSRERSG